MARTVAQHGRRARTIARQFVVGTRHRANCNNAVQHCSTTCHVGVRAGVLSDTEIDYLVVDLEATCDDRNTIPRDDSETIEIGAVRCDGRTLAPIAEFQIFVRPIVHPKLTPFCIALTTIMQAHVDAAPGFVAAAAELRAFGRDALFCSWGAYDRNQLERDARRHGIASPLGPRHVNLKQRFAEIAGDRREVGNRAALARCGIAADGTHHRGLDDARNIARLLPFVLGVQPIPRR
jgi:inhibitor of KinA sporulation pathway (predicted exonuclease)